MCCVCVCVCVCVSVFCVVLMRCYGEIYGGMGCVFFCKSLFVARQKDEI